jgi:outer membrane protein assembly factor BamB
MSDSAHADCLPPRNSIERTLRWWPAAILIAFMAMLRKLPVLFESPDPLVLTIAYMVPTGLAVLLMIWWIGASRASWKEKMLGTIAIATIGLVSVVFSHYTMRSMGLMIFTIPYGILAFAVPLVLLANRPSLRLPVAIVSAAIVFGGCDLLKFGGFSFQLGADLSWRWEATPEENYLKGRSSEKFAESPVSEESIVSLASSAWPGFRGASRDGKLFGITLSEDWTTSPPKLKWKSAIGPGWSSFSVSGSRLFTQEQRGKNEAVVCLDTNTGKTIWDYEYESRFWESVAGAGPRATPTIVDEGLFSLGANGILTCLSPSTGEKIWERDIQVDADRKPPTWGFASSPLVTEGVVIVHAGGVKEKGILAYEATNGRLRWSTASGDHSYSSAQAANLMGVPGVLMKTNAGLQFLNAMDGAVIWNFDSPIQNYRSLQPLVFGNSILLASNSDEGTVRLSVTRDGESWSIKQDWASRDMKSDFNDFVEHQGNLYGFDGNIFACIDLETGKRRWKKGRYGNGQVLMLCDAGQMIVTSEAGELVLLKADSSKMVELAKFHAIDGKTWNHSVVVGNQVFIRNAEEAACYELPTMVMKAP